MNFLQKLFGHLKTIIIHRHNVLKHCIKAGIPWQGIIHDLSKFSWTEFVPGVKFFQGFRSPNEGEREELGYSLAWMHHKGRNRHHYEYWLDYDRITKVSSPVEMPTKFVVEMFCDRVAACKTYMKGNYSDRSPLEYYSRKRGERVIHPSTRKLLELLLNMLVEKGEEATFAYIRTMDLKNTDIKKQ
ncbi:MAG: DUF5662 family protein [Lachnospiraceae bacterium]